MIRFTLCIVLFFITASTISAQYDNGNLDKGYGLLAIDKPLSEIQSFLVKAEPGNLWNRNVQEMEGFITSHWMVNLQKAGLNSYFGLVVERCEVLCDMGYDEKTEAEFENVFSFTFFLKKPENEKQEGDFLNKAYEQYGEANFFLDPEGNVVRWDWFSEITLLVISLGVNVETGEELDYYIADYVQGYGG